MGYYRRSPSIWYGSNARTTNIGPEVRESSVKAFFNLFLDLMQDENAMQKLHRLINQCTEEPYVVTTYTPRHIDNQVARNKNTSWEFRFSVQVGDYDMDNIILDLGSYVKKFLKK